MTHAKLRKEKKRKYCKDLNVRILRSLVKLSILSVKYYKVILLSLDRNITIGK